MSEDHKVFCGNAAFQFRPAPRQHPSKLRILVVVFHGGMPEPKLVFYQRDLDIPGCDVLSMTDSNIFRLREWPFISFFLGTKRNRADLSYERIIRIFVESKQYDRVVFFGSSAGGFSALKYASVFGGEALVGSPILSPREYHTFQSVTRDLSRGGDEIVGPTCVEEIFEQYGYPRRVLLCYNVLDDHDLGYCKHIAPFVRKYQGESWLSCKRFSCSGVDWKSRHCMRWDAKHPVNTKKAIKDFLFPPKKSSVSVKSLGSLGSPGSLGSLGSLGSMWKCYNRKHGVSVSR